MLAGIDNVGKEGTRCLGKGNPKGKNLCRLAGKFVAFRSNNQFKTPQRLNAKRFGSATIANQLHEQPT
jgi:hypothetical protein